MLPGFQFQLFYLPGDLRKLFNVCKMGTMPVPVSGVYLIVMKVKNEIVHVRHFTECLQYNTDSIKTN